MENYESLGKYTLLSEKLRELKSKRTRCVYELLKIISPITNVQTSKFICIDEVGFKNLSTSILSLQDEILKTINDLNFEADICNRPKEDIFKF